MVEALRRAQAMEAHLSAWSSGRPRARGRRRGAPAVQAEALLTALADDCLGLCVMEAGARPLVMLASTCRGARSMILRTASGMRARALLALIITSRAPGSAPVPLCTLDSIPYWR